MPSPFPGMNPYFEQKDHWLDFHTEFLSALRRLLAPQVGPKYLFDPARRAHLAAGAGCRESAVPGSPGPPGP